MFKKENGITLVALVVTIIILLILAGVTLSLALQDGGLIQRSKDSVAKHEQAATNETYGMNEMSNDMANLIEGL